MTITTNLVAVESSLPVGSLNAYIAWANRFPMLTAEEEYALATRLQETGDLDAARRLVLSHLRFVVSMTRRYLGYGLSHDDLIQEGTIGLAKAVKRFDPTKGVRLISFAVHWIKAEVHEYLIRNWRIVKVATTKAQRKLFFNLHRVLKNTQPYSRLTDSEVKNIADDLGVAPKDVRVMEIRLQRNDTSLDQSYEGENRGDGYKKLSGNESLYSLCDNSATDPAQQFEIADGDSNRSARLHQALSKLSPRLRDILQKRWLADKKSTLHELAAYYNVSAERIRQLEKQALTALKQSIV